MGAEHTAKSRAHRKHVDKIRSAKGNGLREQLERMWQDGACRHPGHTQRVMSYKQRLDEAIAQRAGAQYIETLEKMATEYGENTLMPLPGKKVPPVARPKIEWPG